MVVDKGSCCDFIQALLDTTKLKYEDPNRRERGPRLLAKLEIPTCVGYDCFVNNAANSANLLSMYFFVSTT